MPAYADRKKFAMCLDQSWNPPKQNHREHEQYAPGKFELPNDSKIACEENCRSYGQQRHPRDRPLSKESQRKGQIKDAPPRPIGSWTLNTELPARESFRS